jgi:hypothetical protein
MTQPATRLLIRPRAVLRTTAVAAAGLLLLFGCANRTKLPPYAVPAGAPTAKLVMRGAVPSGDLFGVFVHDDAENCKGPRLAGAGSSARNPATASLAAGALTTVEFMLIRSNKESCLLRWSFTPVAGKSYLVNGGAYGAGCRASLLDASDPDAMKPPEGIVRRDAKGNACVTLAQARSTAAGGLQGGQDQGAAVLQPGATADDLKGLIGQ